MGRHFDLKLGDSNSITRSLRIVTNHTRRRRLDAAREDIVDIAEVKEEVAAQVAQVHVINVARRKGERIDVVESEVGPARSDRLDQVSAGHGVRHGHGQAQQQVCHSSACRGQRRVRRAARHRHGRRGNRELVKGCPFRVCLESSDFRDPAQPGEPVAPWTIAHTHTHTHTTRVCVLVGSNKD